MFGPSECIEMTGPKQYGQLSPTADEFFDFREIHKDQETAWNKTRIIVSFHQGVPGLCGRHQCRRDPLARKRRVSVEHLTDFHEASCKSNPGAFGRGAGPLQIGEAFTPVFGRQLMERPDAFTGPGGLQSTRMPPPHYSHGAGEEANDWKIVHFHNTTVDGAASESCERTTEIAMSALRRTLSLLGAIVVPQPARRATADRGKDCVQNCA